MVNYKSQGNQGIIPYILDQKSGEIREFGFKISAATLFLFINNYGFQLHNLTERNDKIGSHIS